MGALNYTTSIRASQTVGEVQTLLVEAGADAVAVRYELRVPVVKWPELAAAARA